MQNFNYQGAKKQNEQLKRTNSSLDLRNQQMMNGMGSREKSTGFLGVPYPNLKFEVDPKTLRPERNKKALQATSGQKTMKSQRSFSSINGHLYPRSLERNTSFTAQVDASCGQMKELRSQL